ncbi:MAG: hypothetical protein AB7F88_03565 [Pyrinomonadaceae bacterium]
MKQSNKLLTGILCLSVYLGAYFVVSPQVVLGQTDAKATLQRGYRTGYSDGYMAGYRDSLDNAARDFTVHSDYEKASRAYNPEYGDVTNYRDGYRQGFELGYAAGYDKRSFEVNVPENITARGLKPIIRAAASVPQAAVTAPVADQPVPPVAADEPLPAADAAPVASNTDTQPLPAADTGYSDSTAAPTTPGSFVKTTFTPVSDAVIIIPKDTELIVELSEAVTTKSAKEGDKFTAKIISPTEIAGAVIEGHISKVTKPGRIKRRSEIQLSFDRIILNQTRWSNFDAVLTEVLPVKGDNIKRVDNEGMAVGQRDYTGDLVKVGAATGTGVTIGAIAGGPVGAAVGAGVGAAFGVGAVIIERGKHIQLRPAQQLRIRTSYETQIR